MKPIYIYHVYPGTRSLAFGLLLCCSIAVYVSCSTTLEAGPESQIVVEGQRVSLICDLNDDNDNSISWTYLIEPGLRRYISFNADIFPSSRYGVDVNNYEILINSQRQTYELVLKVANNTTDTGTYECGFEYGPARKYSVLASAKLTVLQMSDSQECELTLLAMLGESSDQDVQITCSWSHTQAAQVYFRDSNGQVIEPDIVQADRVISCVSYHGYGKVPDVTCMVTLTTNDTIDTTCVGNSAPDGVVRAAPSVSEVYVGSNASFTCNTSDSNTSMSQDVTSTDGTTIINDGTVVQREGELAITNVDPANHSTTIGYKTQIQTNFSVSRFAVLHVVEATTSSSKRPPGESQSNSSTPSTETAADSITALPPVTPDGNNSTIIIIAVTIIIIIVVLLIVIFFLVRGRKGNFHERNLSSNDRTYNTVEYRDIPHITHNGSSQIYAVSFNDKKLKSHQSAASSKHGFGVEDADVSSSCGVLNLQPFVSGDQIEYRDIPHITHNGSSEVYAVSFKDNKSNSLQRPASSKHGFGVEDADVSSSCGVPNLQPFVSGDQIEYRDIPHITHNGSSQVYAISFKDKKSKSRQRPASSEHGFGVEDADNVSPPCGVLNLQPSVSGDQIYAEPDVMPGRTGSDCVK